MNKDIRKYTMKFDILQINPETKEVLLRPITIVDEDSQSRDPIWLRVGDSYEISYTKTVVFQDTLDAGNRKWSFSRQIK